MRLPKKVEATVRRRNTFVLLAILSLSGLGIFIVCSFSIDSGGLFEFLPIEPLRKSGAGKIVDPECGCRLLDDLPVHETSSCGLLSTARGRHQRLISFAFFLSNNETRSEADLCALTSRKSNYLAGVKKNLEKVNEFYPGYAMRVYHDAPLTNEKCQLRRELCQVFCSDKKQVLDLCHVKRVDFRPDLYKSFGMIWRYAPMLDSHVDEWHARDLDALILPREVEAVREWTRTNYSFHVMRDHPDHGTDILGGMFGVRQASAGQKAQRIDDFDAMVAVLRERWVKGSDQVALSLAVAPRAAADSLIHDSYFCNTFFIKGRTVPFPTQRVSGPNFTRPAAPNFVGNVGTYGEDKICPVACRPRDHKDWLLC